MTSRCLRYLHTLCNVIDDVYNSFCKAMDYLNDTTNRRPWMEQSFFLDREETNPNVKATLYLTFILQLPESQPPLWSLLPQKCESTFSHRNGPNPAGNLGLWGRKLEQVVTIEPRPVLYGEWCWQPRIPLHFHHSAATTVSREETFICMVAIMVYRKKEHPEHWWLSSEGLSCQTPGLSPHLQTMTRGREAWV